MNYKQTRHLYGRHILFGLLNLIFGWLRSYSITKKEQHLIIESKILHFFKSDKFEIILGEDDISICQTKYYCFVTDHLIVNGYDEYVPKSVCDDVRSILAAEGIKEAPLICSEDSKEPEFAIQLGRNIAYSILGYDWEYENISYNIVNLTKGQKHLIVNSSPLVIFNDDVLESYIQLLREKGACRDPYILSPYRIIKRSLWQKILALLPFVKITFYNGWNRLPYLLLGKTYCFAELKESKIEDIVYFDYNSHNGNLHFGSGVHFFYPGIKPAIATGIKEYFLSKGAPLLAIGESFTTRRTLNPITLTERGRETVTLGGRGIYFTRKKGNMHKTSFVPYFDLYFINRDWGWLLDWLYGRHLIIYGVQNVITSFPFKIKDYNKILKIIYSHNPALAESKGKAYRSFSWNPFKKKAYFIIHDGLLIHGHPKRKIK